MARIRKDRETGATVASVETDADFSGQQARLRDAEAIDRAVSDITDYADVIGRLEALDGVLDEADGPDADIDTGSPGDASPDRGGVAPAPIAEGPAGDGPDELEGADVTDAPDMPVETVEQEISGEAERTEGGIIWEVDSGAPLSGDVPVDGQDLPEGPDDIAAEPGDDMAAAPGTEPGSAGLPEDGAAIGMPDDGFPYLDPDEIAKNAQASGMAIRDDIEDDPLLPGDDAMEGWDVEEDSWPAVEDTGDRGEAGIPRDRPDLRAALERARDADAEQDGLAGIAAALSRDEDGLEDGLDAEFGELDADDAGADGTPSDGIAFGVMPDDGPPDPQPDIDADPQSSDVPEVFGLPGEDAEPVAAGETDPEAEAEAEIDESSTDVEQKFPEELEAMQDAGNDMERDHPETGDAPIETRADAPGDRQEMQASGGSKVKRLLATTAIAAGLAGLVTFGALSLLGPDEPASDIVVSAASDTGPGAGAVADAPVVADAAVDAPSDAVDWGDLAELSLPEIETPMIPSDAGTPDLPPTEEGLAELARGIDLTPLTGDFEDLFIGFGDSETVEVPSEEAEAEPVRTVSVEDFETLAGAVSTLNENLGELFSAIEDRDREIAALADQLSQAIELARRAESLALAQNEVLVRFVAAEEKLDMAEHLIVDLSRRIAEVEVFDPADRGDVDTRLQRIDERLNGLTTDIGMVARMVLNGSPQRIEGRQGSGQVFDRGRSDMRSPVADPANVPRDAAVGDFVNGYGAVLEVFQTSEGGRMIVMENGTVILN